MGKGSARRNEDIKKVWDNWDAIFSKKNKQEETDKKDIKEEKIDDNTSPETNGSEKNK